MSCENSKRRIALVDCNNFYASCERVFHPEWETRPVAVLSNNDGCIVARSNELKALGVPMGMPFFQAKALLKKHRVVTVSSNYALYADMSNRVMNVVSRFTPEVEIYSIDEAFLDLTGTASSLGLRVAVLPPRNWDAAAPTEVAASTQAASLDALSVS